MLQTVAKIAVFQTVGKIENLMQQLMVNLKNHFAIHLEK